MKLVISAFLFIFTFGTFAVEENDDHNSPSHKAIQSLQRPAEFEINIFATYPMFGNPVAFDVDRFGNVYVAEQYRFNQGTQENRTSNFFLDDDLQISSLEDRLAMYQKWQHKFKDGMKFFTSTPDIIRLVQDTDDDGKADKSSVFAEFKETLDGLNSGVMMINGDVWATCIPNLWRLKDTNGDGVAEIKDKVHTGFGVRASFLGHDLHGLAHGPDNRLYFSLGDRGYNVTTKEGKKLFGPDNGAVFRCDLDGSNLEVVHNGLRNPQEIAFDEFGNLFTGDNNCDKGDKSRLVYVVDGGDSGWRMNYQSMSSPANGGSWIKEELWKTESPLFPESSVPAVGYIGAGPSGLAYSSVGAWPEEYRNMFYHMNFSGGSGIITFKTVPVGAGFKITEYKNFLTPSPITDCTFGYDGKLYVSNYPANPWKLDKAGELFTLSSKNIAEEEKLALKNLAKKDFSQMPPVELIKLLGHKDSRIRLRAQLTLSANHHNLDLLSSTASSETAPLLARLHAIWGLWNIARTGGKSTSQLHSLAHDSETEVRAQAIKVLADIRDQGFEDGFLKALSDKSPRVQYFAAEGLGRIQSAKAVNALVTLIKNNASQDKFIQHAAVTALSRIGQKNSLDTYFSDSSEHLRMAIVLVLQKWQDPRVAAFLKDTNDKIVLQTARAIYESDIVAAYQELAAAGPRASSAQQPFKDAIQRRIMTVNRRLAKSSNFQSVLEIYMNKNNSEHIQKIAFDFLIDWNQIVNRDLITGKWWPQPKGSLSDTQKILAKQVQLLLSDDLKNSWSKSIKLLDRHQVKAPLSPINNALVKGDDKTKIEAFKYLEKNYSTEAAKVAISFLNSKSASLRTAGLNYLKNTDPKNAVSVYSKLLENNNTDSSIRQSCLQNLSQINTLESQNTLIKLMNDLNSGKAIAEIRFDILEAAKKLQEHSPKLKELIQTFEAKTNSSDPLAKFNILIAGGNAKNGKKLVNTHQIAQCTRCHKVGNAGGLAGPDLSHVATKLKPEQLLESLIVPNAQIAPGFGIVTITTKNGKSISGVVISESEKEIILSVTPEKKETVQVADIASKIKPISMMPPMGLILKPNEIRDILAYLKTLK